MRAVQKLQREIGSADTAPHCTCFPFFIFISNSLLQLLVHFKKTPLQLAVLSYKIVFAPQYGQRIHFLFKAGFGISGIFIVSPLKNSSHIAVVHFKGQCDEPLHDRELIPPVPVLDLGQIG